MCGALFRAQPSARKTVKSAAGCDAFNNFGMKLLLAGSGKGEGNAGNNKTTAATYMRPRRRVPGCETVGPGVWLYQLTGKGLAVEFTAKRTKYYADDEPN